MIIRVNGFNPFGDWFERAEKACQERIKDNPNLVVLYDLESGHPYVATKEYQQQLIDLWENCKPKFIDADFKDKIIYYGTGGEMDKNGYEDIFYNADKFNSKEE